MLLQKQVTSVLNKHKQRDSWFLDDYSVNPYEGCSCNCQYCYIRGSKYGENMEEKLAVKANAPEVLEKQLANRAKKNQYGIVVVGSATDAYLHHEKELHRTEAFLKLLLKYRFPVFISTKCNLILRDIDLLKEIDRTAILPDDLRDHLKRGVILSVSVSTMDETIAQTLEPGAISPIERLQLIQQLKTHGFLCGVNAIPVLPFISDTEEGLEQIISSAKQHDADYILVGGLTLFGNNPADSKTLYFKFIERKFHHLISSYHQLYGEKFFPPWWYQEQLQQRVSQLCKKYKIRNSILEKL
ncbi:MAG TPA: radical SAM protein [Chitinophagales bacterium]|nr:radical SAM protein [Chitinophagales bacterium]